MTRLTREYFERPTLTVARDLLGKKLVKIEGGVTISGLIVETEAYVGTTDLGCHASAGRTKRNDSMWGAAGHAYVYFTYGMHWLLNFVTEAEGMPAAVLIRALVATEGIETMQERRSGRPLRELTNGPAKLCQALGVNGAFDGLDLCRPGSMLYVEEAVALPDSEITEHPRVGLNSVPEPFKSILWNFQPSPQALKTLLK